MKRLVVIVFALGSVVACITGPSTPTADCASNATGGCTCTSVTSGKGNEAVCGPTDAGSPMTCCADFHFPEVGGQKCTCTPLTVGCETGNGPYCECHQTFDSSKPTTANCTAPTKWAVCCKSIFSGCFCDANPGHSCSAGDTIAKCDATIEPNARCVLTPSGTCSCDPSNATGTATCPPPAPLVCCLNETEGWCRCNPGVACAAGSKGVPSCTTDLVATAAAATAFCGSSLASRVTSCSPLTR